MVFKDNYTTAEKITADKDEIEIKKTTLSNDAFAVGDMLQQLFNKLEHLRTSR